MSDVVISVEDLSKAYRLGTIGGGTLRVDAARWWARKRGKPDPYLRIGQKDYGNQEGETVWALRDVNMQVKQGEIVGIIGRNGAGKSTLLKILSRITAPTEGQVKIKGRIGSLLEVGTGFHPELTGRENIYLNGAILGMTKVEVARKFDEIVDFSGVEQYIDTPVKRYSSGMSVRLAFAVAAHLDPEILIVDEVLAVGDAEFRKKSLGKMSDVAKAGRTVLFVSHNMGAITTLTSRCVLLLGGRIAFDDQTSTVVSEYINHSTVNHTEVWYATSDNENPIQIVKVRITGNDNNNRTELDVCESISIHISYKVRRNIANAVIAVNIHAQDGTHLMSLEDIDSNPQLLDVRIPGEYVSTVKIPGGWLNRGYYYVRVGSGIPRVYVYDNIEAIGFTLVDTGNVYQRGHRKGILVPMLEWKTV